MKQFVLLPYSESKELEGSEDMPIIYKGRVFPSDGWEPNNNEVIDVIYKENIGQPPMKDCHQLCIKETCKACEATNGILKSNHDCQDGFTYRIYMGDNTKQIVEVKAGEFHYTVSETDAFYLELLLKNAGKPTIPK